MAVTLPGDLKMVGLEKILANRWNRTRIAKEALAGCGLEAIEEIIHKHDTW
jgi:hypothetical protein